MRPATCFIKHVSTNGERSFSDNRVETLRTVEGHISTSRKIDWDAFELLVSFEFLTKDHQNNYPDRVGVMISVYEKAAGRVKRIPDSSSASTTFRKDWDLAAYRTFRSADVDHSFSVHCSDGVKSDIAATSATP